jgi:predicted AAA+ superfamily ATPase
MAPVTKIQADIKLSGQTIDRRTIESYIMAFKKLHVIEEVPSWSPKLRKETAIRVAAVRQFSEPSIATAISRLTPAMLVNDTKTLGLLFKSLCIRDLRIYASMLHGSISQYHDADGLEIDAIIHLEDGKWAAIEIKLGSVEGIADGVKHLLDFQTKINNSTLSKPTFYAVVTGTTFNAYRRADGIYIIPITCLKN